jgi:hypothetical protein
MYDLAIIVHRAMPGRGLVLWRFPPDIDVRVELSIVHIVRWIASRKWLRCLSRTILHLDGHVSAKIEGHDEDSDPLVAEKTRSTSFERSVSSYTFYLLLGAYNVPPDPDSLLKSFM